MKSYLDCVPCFFEQALRAGRIATDDEQLQKRVLDELGAMLSDISLESTPPETGRLIYRMVSEITGNPDPFRQLKRESTQHVRYHDIVYNFFQDMVYRVVILVS